MPQLRVGLREEERNVGDAAERDHILVPYRQPPHRRAARVRIEAASEPDSASVSPKHPKLSPEQSPAASGAF